MYAYIDVWIVLFLYVRLALYYMLLFYSEAWNG